jgi:MFS family permease
MFVIVMTLSSSLITAICVQFGGHFAKNIAPLKTFFSADPNWTISTTEWGMFQAAVVLPCTVFPWLLGHAVDGTGDPKSVLVSALIIVCIGECMFILASKSHLFTSALVGRFVFGIGEGLTSSLSVFMAARYVPKYKMTAIGITQAFHSLAIASSKASLAYIANACGNYLYSLIVSLIVCGLSLLAGILWRPYTRRNMSVQVCDGTFPEGDPFISPRSEYTRARLCCQGRPGKLTMDFWLVAIIHLLVSSSHRLFGHIDAAFLREKFGHTTAVAGGVSSITEFVAVLVAPILGFTLDSYCTIHTLPTLLLIASCGGGIAYSILAWGTCNDTGLSVVLVVIGIVNGITPTVMKSVIPETVHENVLATAFGIYESSESVGVVFGSVGIGFLAELYDGKYDICIPMFGSGLMLAAFLSVILTTRRVRKIRGDRDPRYFSPLNYCPIHDE